MLHGVHNVLMHSTLTHIRQFLTLGLVSAKSPSPHKDILSHRIPFVQSGSARESGITMRLHAARIPLLRKHSAIIISNRRNIWENYYSFLFALDTEVDLESPETTTSLLRFLSVSGKHVPFRRALIFCAFTESAEFFARRDGVAFLRLPHINDQRFDQTNRR